MKMQIGAVILAAILSGGISMQAADVPTRSASQIARDEAQQLLRERDEARPKAKDAEQKLKDAGKRVAALGFESAKALRDQQAASGDKGTAYRRYAAAAKEIEKKIKGEVERGTQPILAADIARYERLQAEVDLARLLGRLPARE